MQKPKIRILSTAIAAEGLGTKDWKSRVPAALRPHIVAAVDSFFGTACGVKSCSYQFPHGDLRAAVETLTKLLKGVEKQPKTAFVTDNKTGISYPAPQIIQDLQDLGSAQSRLNALLSVDRAWRWWVNSFSADTALSSDEVNEAKKNPDFAAPAHPLADFSWGSGNMKDTLEGHSIPAFNKVRSSSSLLPSASNISGRPYGYLCEGDHLGMARLSREYKKKGLSLGHTPAPLRWLGKNDPSNAVAEPLSENVQKRDSLRELYEQAIKDPELAASFVSWQVRDVVIDLGEKKPSFEAFTSRLQAATEKYFDDLLVEIDREDGGLILEHIKRADPGKTATVYNYRLNKVRLFLTTRPNAKRG